MRTPRAPATLATPPFGMLHTTSGVYNSHRPIPTAAHTGFSMIQHATITNTICHKWKNTNVGGFIVVLYMHHTTPHTCHISHTPIIHTEAVFAKQSTSHPHAPHRPSTQHPTQYPTQQPTQQPTVGLLKEITAPETLAAKAALAQGDSLAAMEAFAKLQEKKAAQLEQQQEESGSSRAMPLLNETSFDRRRVTAVYKDDGTRGHHMQVVCGGGVCVWCVWCVCMKLSLPSCCAHQQHHIMLYTPTPTPT